ncbi:hypothetical protein [Pyxidicoccus xibeiensis]|uniref:hypothetical protein n=1 Tax=Pyxidicoccus xibeiensis TaxID=2906759 RepID=UPI0020A76C2E|nr:hypothetical protein [Pyxidicoccus xibeiensis]MCP3142270.1 hypothetical protein [Pyxidicoccus xibeiensis]
MIFANLLLRYRTWRARQPSGGLARLISELPEAAFSMKGALYTRAELMGRLTEQYLEFLLDAVAWTGEFYEQIQKRRLPDTWWRELQEVSTELGYPEAIKDYWVDGQRASELPPPPPRPEAERLADFLGLVEQGHFQQLKSAGLPPVEVAEAMLEEGGGEIATVKELRALYGLDLDQGMKLLREAQRQLSENPEGD